MSQTLELPLNTRCYLCESFFSQSHNPFIVYKCFCCLQFTPHCYSCEKILQKLFGRGNLFKCSQCNKLTNSLDKIEISPHNILMNINNLNQISQSISTNNSYLKTPIKPLLENNSPITSIRCNKMIIPFSKKEEERKDNNSICSNNNVISNFINEFKLIDLAVNSSDRNITQNNKIGNNSENNNNLMNNSLSLNRNNFISNFNDNSGNISNNTSRTLTNSNSVNNFRKLDYSLLASRRRINRKFCINNNSFLGRKRDESDASAEFRGYNKSKDKGSSNYENRNILGTSRPNKLISKNMSRLYSNRINSNTVTRGKFGLSSTLNNFKRDNNEYKNDILKFNGSFVNPLTNNFNKNSNIFINQNGIFGQGINTISGTATPHKFYTNIDEQYF